MQKIAFLTRHVVKTPVNLIGGKSSGREPLFGPEVGQAFEIACPLPEDLYDALLLMESWESLLSEQVETIT